MPLDDRYEAGDHPPRHRSHVGALMDEEFDPGCTRTLFVGNIEKTTTFADLKDAFERYGEIVVSLPFAKSKLQVKERCTLDAHRVL